MLPDHRCPRAPAPDRRDHRTGRVGALQGFALAGLDLVELEPHIEAVPGEPVTLSQGMALYL